MKIKLSIFLAAAFTIVAIVPVLFLGFWVEKTALEREVAAVADKHLLLASNLAVTLEVYADDTEAAFRIFSTRAQESLPTKGLSGLAQQLGFRHLSIVNNDGSFVQQLSFENDFGIEFSPGEKSLIQNFNSEGVTFTQVTADGLDRPTILLLQRLSPRRIAVGALSTDHMVRLQRAITFGQRGHAVIVDQFGNTIAHPSAEWQREMKDITKLKPIGLIVQGEKSGVASFYSPVMNGDMIAGFTVVPKRGWGVMVPQPMEELEERAREVQIIALAIAVIGFALAGVLALLFTRLLTGPVAAVVKAARKMSEGRLETRVPLGSKVVPQEFTELRETFNTMAVHVHDGQEKMMTALEEAQLADRAKSEFLANMSHELRTPLNAIIGFSEIVQAELFGPIGDEKYKEYITDIHGSGTHLLNVINDILDIARIESGHMEIHDGEVDLDTLLTSCQRLVRGRAKDSGLTLETEVASNLPILIADERALKQIVLNLLSNAVKFTPEGGTIRINAFVAADSCLHLAISDTGIGVEQDDLPKILEAFGQADSALERKYEGTGLGLPLTKSLVELHGGRLEIDSVVGEGTTVTVVLPSERLLMARVKPSAA